MAQLARRETAACGRQVLESGELDRVHRGLTGPGGALVLAGELEPVEEVAEAVLLGLWLWTHWPSVSTMPV